MEYYSLQKRFRPTGIFLKKHNTKINCVLTFFPLLSIILILLYAVFYPEEDVDFFFWCFPAALAITFCGIIKQHYEDIGDEKRFRDTLRKADEAILLLRERHRRLDERYTLLEELSAGCGKILDSLYLELIKRSHPVSRN